MKEEEIEYLLNPTRNENEPIEEYKSRRRTLKAALKLYNNNKVSNEKTTYLDYVLLYVAQQRNGNI